MSDTIKVLEAQLAAVENDSSGDNQAKIDILNQVAWSLRFSNVQHGLALSQQAYELAGAWPGYQIGVIHSLRNLGYYHERLANYDQALLFLFQALSLLETSKDLPVQATILYIIGGVYWSRGDYEQALDYELKALTLSEAIGEQTCAARALNIIGLIHQSSGEVAKALTYFVKSLQIFQEINDLYGQGDTLNNIGDAYFDLGDYAEALSYSLKSWRVHEETGYLRDRGLVLISVGRAYLAMNEATQALVYFQQSLEASHQTGNRFNQLLALVNLGHTYHRQRQPDPALTYLYEALVLAEETNSKMELCQCHQLLAEVYEQQANFKAALHHYKQFHALKERIFNEETDKKYKNLQVAYEAETALKEAKAQQQKNMQLEQEIAERRQVEEALRESNERFATAFQVMPMGVGIYHMDGRIIEMNTMAMKSLGYSRDELIGRTTLELGLWTDPSERARLVGLLQAGQSLRNAEARLQTKLGQTLTVLISAKKVELRGEPCIFSVFVDITERKQLEEELRERTAQLEALRQIGLALATELDVDILLQTIVHRAKELLQAERGAIYLYRPDPGVLELVILMGSELEPAGTILQRGQGLAGKVWETGEPMIVNDYNHWPGQVIINPIHPIFSVVSVPIRWGQEFLGVLNVANRPTPFSTADVELLNLLGIQAASAIRTARLVRSLQENEQQYRQLLFVERRQAQELALLDQVRTVLARELHLPTLLRVIVEAIAETFGYSLVSLYLLKGDMLELQHQVGYNQIITQIPISKGISGRVVRTGQPVLITDVHAEPEFLGAIEGIVSEICVPLFEQDRVAGFFNIESTQGVVYDEADLRLMIALSEHINLALSRARLYTEAKESVERFRQLAENIHDVFWMTNLDGSETIYVSPAYETLWGRSCQSRYEQPGSWLEGVHPEDREWVRLSFNQRDNTKPQTKEYRLRQPHGAIRWVQERAFPILNEAGQLYRVAGIVADITERKQVEQALRANEARYRAIVEDQTDLICRFRPDGVLTFVNEPYARFFGRSRETWAGQNVLHLIVRDNFKDFKQFINSPDPENPVNIAPAQRVTRVEGQVRWLQWTDRAIFDEQGRVLEFQSVGRDVTELMVLQEALRKSEQRYHIISDLTSDYAYAFRLNAQGKLILDWITEAFARVTGCDPLKIKSWQDWLKLLHPDDTPMMYQRLKQILTTGELDVSEFRIITSSGETRWLRNYIRPIWDSEHNQVINLYGAAQDITERKQAERALRESERSYRELAQERARLYDETRQRLNYQMALSKAAAAISSSLDLGTVLRDIAEQLGQAIDATSTYISLYDEETKTSKVVAEYFSPLACLAEKVSDLETTYYLPEDFPGVYTFLQSNQPVLIQHRNDPDLPPADQAHMIEFGAWSILMVRLELGGRIIGQAALWESRTPRTFSTTEIALCQSIAQHAAIAIKNAQLYAETQQRLKEQTALHEAAMVISSTLDLPTVLKYIAEQIGRAVDVTSALIASFEPEHLSATILAEYHSPQASELERANSDLGRTYYLPGEYPGIIEFIQTGQLRVSQLDTPGLAQVELNHMQQFGAQSILVIPLQIRGQTLGFAELWESRRRREFTPPEKAIGQGIAQHAAMAIEHARLLEQARRDAETKTILLQEVNHRVKNNLATIIGLLYAERRHANAESQELLQTIMQDLVNRVQGLATVHSMLSTVEWAPLSLRELTLQVIDSVRQALPSDKQAFVQVTPSSVRVTAQQANNLALVISELATNTVKYALAERDSVRIEVKIHREPGLIQFEFQDDGPGYVAETLDQKQHNVGMYLIYSIVRKGLQGEVYLRNDPGAAITICFPEKIE
jgi:PAS domain S-box-containing protein